ncbi:MAG: imidazole glycerol phosphate synthase subunit HisF, partial [Candidatus Omnitrophica bacterium]|nr:imidazole glycerol phosphate synthase subunit HisF [Candidatus Omnitrophota bacterium]
QRFGSQCIVVAVDAKRRHPNRQAGKPASRQTVKWEVYIHGGRTATGLDAIEWVKKVEALGAGEILLTSMDCDGTNEGYDLELTRQVSEAVSMPVIASGGAGSPEDIFKVFDKAKADAALCASIFHYNKYSINDVKTYLKKKGVTVRI